MQADELYRFVALRSVEQTPREVALDPHVDAYGPRAAGGSTLLPAVTDALEQRDIPMARAQASDFVGQLSLGADGAWSLVEETPIRQIALALPALVRAGDVAEADKVIARLLDISPENLADVGDRFVAVRTLVADFLLCQALLPDLAVSVDATAQILLCLETFERLTGSATQRDAWRVPLSTGRLVLPVELFAQPQAQRYGLKSLLSGSTDDEAPEPPARWIGDLVLLRQHVRGYQLGEIAHVENALLGESFERTFRTTRRTEQRTTQDEEVERETERDQQSTTRDELRKEIEKSVSEEVALAANFDVQASFSGGAYSVVASVGAAASYRRASDEREATSSLHAREVIDKARERISTRVRTIQESMSSYEQEDVAKHGLDNKLGTDHMVGVYRWLEKRLDLHLINYGRRLMYEFFVPEPATFWKRLVATRGSGAAGDPPTFPVLPAVAQGGTETLLTPADFALRAGANVLSQPARWTDLIRLAADWGVQLEDPPAIAVQAHLSFSQPGAADQKASTAINEFGNKNNWYYESSEVTSGVEKERLKVPDGYIARTGLVALKGWMYIRTKRDGWKQYERGTAVLMLNGRRFGVSEGIPGGLEETSPLGNQWDLSENLLLQGGLKGDVAVALTTSLNSVSGSIRLNCERTGEHENAWARRTFGLFADAYQARLAEYHDAQTRASLDNNRWAGSFPSATCREIERRELKRGIVSQMTLNNLDALGNAIVTEPAAPSPSELPAAPVTRLGQLDEYGRIVSFFEQGFDWTNMAYVFAPYIYGRRSEWAGLAVADDADAQFKGFLGAGAARVQVPVRRGYEAHVEYFFNGLGLFPFEQRIPWLSSMRSIAEDLAAEAREGFEVGAGTVSVTQGSTVVTGTGTLFLDPEDINREIRIDGRLHVIASVESGTRIRLTRPYAGATAADIAYETGGIVIGPTIAVTLPTTLVAIDTQAVALPQFPGRYA